MKILKFTRSAEWWEYKLVPLVAIGYATLLITDIPLFHAGSRLVFLLLSIITGAIYVSVINDLTDIKEDALAGKKNRMASISILWRVIIVSICIIAGFIWGYLIYPDVRSIFFYTMAWIVFSLYSLPPVRLKKRGVWGLLGDATGAHLFPTLLIISNLYYFSQQRPGLVWFIASGIWALCYGLRGILWHQFYDRENDIKTGTRTFASRVSPHNFKLQEKIITGIELAAFITMLSYFFNLWTGLAISLYIVLVIIRKKSFGYKICLIMTPQSSPHQLLMNDFYLVFFPLSLLFTIALTQSYGWIGLGIHLLLFPAKTLLVLKDFYIFFRNRI